MWIAEYSSMCHVLTIARKRHPPNGYSSVRGSSSSRQCRWPRPPTTSDIWWNTSLQDTTVTSSRSSLSNWIASPQVSLPVRRWRERQCPSYLRRLSTSYSITREYVHRSRVDLRTLTVTLHSSLTTVPAAAMAEKPWATAGANAWTGGLFHIC